MPWSSRRVLQTRSVRETHCPFPVRLAYETTELNPAAALRDLGLHVGGQVTDRNSHPPLRGRRGAGLHPDGQHRASRAYPSARARRACIASSTATASATSARSHSSLLTSGLRPASSSYRPLCDPAAPWSFQPASGRLTHAKSSEARGGQPPYSASTDQQARVSFDVAHTRDGRPYENELLPLDDLRVAVV